MPPELLLQFVALEHEHVMGFRRHIHALEFDTEPPATSLPYTDRSVELKPPMMLSVTNGQ